MITINFESLKSGKGVKNVLRNWMVVMGSEDTSGKYQHKVQFCTPSYPPLGGRYSKNMNLHVSYKIYYSL